MLYHMLDKMEKEDDDERRRRRRRKGLRRSEVGGRYLFSFNVGLHLPVQSSTRLY